MKKPSIENLSEYKSLEIRMGNMVNGVRGNLIIQLQGATVQTVSLLDGPCNIGRLPDNQVVLPIPPVSRRHANILMTPNGPIISDLNSQSGTYVAGIRLNPFQGYPLIPGVSVQIGLFVLVYVPVNNENDPLEKIELFSEVEIDPVDFYKESKGAIAAEKIDLPTRGASLYLLDLPQIFHESDFLGRYLQIFESFWEPLNWRLDHFPMMFNPRTSPVELLPWIVSWFGFEMDARVPEDRKRRLTEEIVDLYRWRGTHYGLTKLIDICTGFTPQIVQRKEPYVFSVLFSVPSSITFDHDLVRSLIERHKPAHMAYVVEVTNIPVSGKVLLEGETGTL